MLKHLIFQLYNPWTSKNRRPWQCQFRFVFVNLVRLFQPWSFSDALVSACVACQTTCAGCRALVEALVFLLSSWLALSGTPWPKHCSKLRLFKLGLPPSFFPNLGNLSLSCAFQSSHTIWESCFPYSQTLKALTSWDLSHDRPVQRLSVLLSKTWLDSEIRFAISIHHDPCLSAASALQMSLLNLFVTL